MRVRLEVLILSGVIACHAEQPSAIEPVGPTSQPAVTGGSCSSVGNSQFNNSFWAAGTANRFPCGAMILLVPTSNSTPVSITTDVLNSAAGIWNSSVLQNYGLPQFTTSGASNYRVLINETGSGQYICGVTAMSGGNEVITVTHSPSASSCGDVPSATPFVTPGVDKAVQLIAHELGHALGFNKHFLEVQSTVDQDTIVRDCINVVPTVLNGSVCELERQIIYYQYAVGAPNPAPTKVFVYGINTTPAALSLDLNQSGTATAASLLLIDHNNREGVAAPFGSGAEIQWNFLSLTPAGSFTLTDNGTTAAVTAISPGSGVIQANLTSSLDYNIVWPFNARPASNGQVPLSNPGPTAAPSHLVVSSVTSTSAILGWTSGDTRATTLVQDRQTSIGGSWTTAGTASVSVTTFNLTGLSACTPYDVQLTHFRNGISSAAYTVVSAFVTNAPSGVCVATPGNFHIIQCHAEGNFEYYDLGWTRTEFSSGSTFEIGQATTNNSANATVISSGSSATTTATIGPYDRRKLTSYYFWVRQKLANGTPSAWAALYDNPVRPNQGC